MQVQTLEQAARGRFLDRVVDDLRAAYPDIVGARPRSRVRADVDAAWKRARRYDLSNRRDLIAFAELSLLVSPSFDRHPPFAKILEDPDMPPERRVEQLFLRATPESWLAAAELP